MSEIDKSEASRLLAELAKAEDCYRKVKERYNIRERELDAAVHRTLESEFGEELRAAIEQQRRVRLAYDAEEDRLRTLESKAKLPYAEGTVLHEWRNPRYHWSDALHLTGKTGVIEIFKEGDDWPSNQKWTRPAIGLIILRYLKKDGSKGKDGETWSPYVQSRWLPEGVKPKG